MSLVAEVSHPLAGASSGGVTEDGRGRGIPIVARALNAGRDGYNDGSDQTYLPTYWDGGDVADTLDKSMLGKGQMMPEKRRFAAVVVPPEVESFEPRYYTRENKTGGEPSDTAQITNAKKAGDSAPHVFVSEVAASLSAGTDAARGRAPGRRREDDENLVSPSLDSQSNASAGGYPGVAGVAEALERAGAGVRRLTPTECERLQGLPDGWTAPTGREPDSRRYAALGDAVTANVAEWIGKRLALYGGDKFK